MAANPVHPRVHNGRKRIGLHLPAFGAEPSGNPRRVIAFILCHELIHLLVPPRDVDGKRKSHPPEFWEAERKRSPDRGLAWGWVILVLGACLRSNRKKECTFVKRNWKCHMNGGRPTLEQLSLHLGLGKCSADRFLDLAHSRQPLCGLKNRLLETVRFAQTEVRNLAQTFE